MANETEKELIRQIIKEGIEDTTGDQVIERDNQKIQVNKCQWHALPLEDRSIILVVRHGDSKLLKFLLR